MLVLKQISSKKLAIYIFIIVVMLGGTGLIIYRNQKPADQDADLAVINDSQEPDQSSAKENLPSAFDSIKTNAELDLSIFEQAKFKALKANILLPEDNTSQGKVNPFKPN